MRDIYTIKNIKKIRWGVLEENQPIGLYPVMYPGWDGIIKDTMKIFGRPQKNIINLNRGNHSIIFVDHKEWTELGEYALRKIIRNPKWGLALNRQILQLSDKLVAFSSKLAKANLKKLSAFELYKLYKKYLELHSDLYNRAIVPVYLDLYKPHLTNYLVEYLNEQVRKVGHSRSAKECFALLTIPEEISKVQEEERALLRLANKNRTDIKGHADKFRYLGYNFEGPAFPDSYFKKRLAEMKRDSITPVMRLRNLERTKSEIRAKHLKLVNDLKIDAKHKILLDLTQGFIYSKDYRKMSLVQSYYEIEPVLRELSSRLHLTLREIRNTLLVEIKDMVMGKIIRPAELSQRLVGCLYVLIERDMPGRVFVDARFRAMKHYLLKNEDLKEVNYFHGQPACLGKARGRVKIINSVKDLSKMKKGDILVSQMTNPDLLPAMKIAGAIVTDLGGITSHAAIVSRELHVPCVIGTKIASKVLKDGDLVEVDANSGEIRKV